MNRARYRLLVISYTATVVAGQLRIFIRGRPPAVLIVQRQDLLTLSIGQVAIIGWANSSYPTPGQLTKLLICCDLGLHGARNRGTATSQREKYLGDGEVLTISTYS